MRKLEVGQPLEPGVAGYDELPEYNYRSGQHRLILFLRNVTAQEIEAVRSASVKLAFTVINDVLIFQYRFGSVIRWSDATYTWHKVPAEEQIRPPRLTGAQRALLEIILVEATTGVIEVLRLVSMSPTFSQRLHTAIERQADTPFPADYDAQARRIFSAYSSNQLRDRALASCTGGDTTDRPSPY